MPRQRADAARGLQPVHVRHLHVHQDHVVGGCRRALQRLQAVLGHVHRVAAVLQHGGGDGAVDQVIVHQQHPAARPRPGGHHGWRRGLRLLERQALVQPRSEPEAAAHPRLAVGAGIAVHQPRQLAGDDQAQAGAAVLPRGGVVGLLEGGEQPVQRGRCDAHAGVLDLEAQAQPPRILVLHPRPQHHLAVGGEAHRIGRVVQQRLLQPRGVAHQRLGGHLHIHHQRQALGLRR